MVANKPVTISYKDTSDYKHAGGIILEECPLEVIHDLIKERYLGTREDVNVSLKTHVYIIAYFSICRAEHVRHYT